MDPLRFCLTRIQRMSSGYLINRFLRYRPIPERIIARFLRYCKYQHPPPWLYMRRRGRFQRRRAAAQSYGGNRNAVRFRTLFHAISTIHWSIDRKLGAELGCSRGEVFFFRELGIHLSTCLVLIAITGGRVPLGCQMKLYEFLDWLCTLHVSQLNLYVPVCFISAATPTRNALDLDPVDARLMKIDMPAKFAPAPRASSRRQAHSLRWLAPLDAFRKQITVAFQ